MRARGELFRISGLLCRMIILRRCSEESWEIEEPIVFD
jgi:hypothetical protein